MKSMTRLVAAALFGSALSVVPAMSPARGENCAPPFAQPAVENTTLALHRALVGLFLDQWRRDGEIVFAPAGGPMTCGLKTYRAGRANIDVKYTPQLGRRANTLFKFHARRGTAQHYVYVSSYPALTAAFQRLSRQDIVQNVFFVADQTPGRVNIYAIYEGQPSQAEATRLAEAIFSGQATPLSAVVIDDNGNAAPVLNTGRLR